jgi:hypothetical protein
MKTHFEDGLLFVSSFVIYKGKGITLSSSGLSTGSVGTAFASHQKVTTDVTR